MNGTAKELPTGWCWARLGDHVTKVGSGITPLGGQAVYIQSGIPLIRSQNVQMNRFAQEGLVFVSSEQDATMEASRVFPGDVLLNITGASIGRCCVVPADLCPANVNQHVSIIRCRESVDPYFVSFWISTPGFQRFIMEAQAGATRQALTKVLIEDFRIPLPPLREQERIVAVLNEQMAAVERARAAALARLEAAKALPAAHLRAVFGTGDARTWPRDPLGTLVACPLKTGISKPSNPASMKRCLTLSAVRGGGLDLSASKPVEVSDEEAVGNWVRPGAFYVVRGNGNRSLVGRGGLAPPILDFPVLYPPTFRSWRREGS